MPDGFDIELDIEGFRQWTEAAIAEVEKEVAGKVLRAVALEFIKRVIEKTPVDFGRARAGWASYAVHLGRSPRIGSANREGSRRTGLAHESATDAQRTGLAEGEWREHLRGTDQFIELINGVPYIVHLEFGSSKQAPAGMMRLTFREMMAADVLTEQMARDLKASFIRVNRRLARQRRKVA